MTVLQQCVQDVSTHEVASRTLHMRSVSHPLTFQPPSQQNIQAFYPPGSLDMIAAQVASSGALDKIANEWRMPKELATDLVKISLFDVVLYVDDSGESWWKRLYDVFG